MLLLAIQLLNQKNGWIKQEIYIDFDINNFNTVQEYINDIVYNNNHLRLSYSLNYKTSIQYNFVLGFN